MYSPFGIFTICKNVQIISLPEVPAIICTLGKFKNKKGEKNMEVKHEVIEFGDLVVIDEVTIKRISFGRDEIEAKKELIAETKSKIAHDEEISVKLEEELAELVKYIELADAKKADVESAEVTAPEAVI